MEIQQVKTICDDCRKPIADSGVTSVAINPFDVSATDKQVVTYHFCEQCKNMRLVQSVLKNNPFKDCPLCGGRGFRRVEVSFDGHRSDYENVSCSHIAYINDLKESLGV